MRADLPATTKFDQWLLDAALKTPLRGLGNRARYRLLRGIRRLRLSLSDPPVSFSLGPYLLRVPLSHELPFYKRRLPDYALNLGKVSALARLKYPDLKMIDVGANVGDSVAIVRGYGDHPVLCLEGEPRFFQLLEQNTQHLPAIELEQTFIGVAGDHVSSISTQRGNAQVRLGAAPGTANICTLSEALSRHPRFATAKLLKIDAEGFDCRIIAAEAGFLRRLKPVLFFEYDPKSCELLGQEAFPVFAQLSSLGYSTMLIYQNVGRYLMSLNLDQVDALEDIHHFISDLGGYCDVVAFHREDLDLAIRLRTSEYASRATQGAPLDMHCVA
jgi:FkbM family methyltransferase